MLKRQERESFAFLTLQVLYIVFKKRDATVGAWYFHYRHLEFSFPQNYFQYLV